MMPRMEKRLTTPRPDRDPDVQQTFEDGLRAGYMAALAAFFSSPVMLVLALYQFDGEVGNRYVGYYGPPRHIHRRLLAKEWTEKPSGMMESVALAAPFLPL